MQFRGRERKLEREKKNAKERRRERINMKEKRQKKNLRENGVIKTV